MRELEYRNGFLADRSPKEGDAAGRLNDLTGVADSVPSSHNVVNPTWSEEDDMGAQKKSPIPPERIEVYEKLVASLPGVECKGADNPYTSLKGNMFTVLLSPEGRLALRLPPDEREQYLKRYKTTLFEAYGAVMREYVAVPEALFRKPKELQKYFALSYAYAKTLKPKPTRKKR